MPFSPALSSLHFVQRRVFNYYERERGSKIAFSQVSIAVRFRLISIVTLESCAIFLCRLLNKIRDQRGKSADCLRKECLENELGFSCTAALKGVPTCACYC